ncbi:MAG: hypothetical protein EX271_01150 [Acidimicrobiales bacterium]|nr:hypothetical protein [Hyphomonadaceae bacterium]RZV44684.1 MAG: hypothetical protein EX271_01150 [Acidimicrobiales bacterium]
MLVLAKVIVAISALWLIAVSVMMIYRPSVALTGLSKMAGTNMINYTELSLRLIAGLAFIIAAPLSSVYLIFHYFGWFLAVSAIVLMAIPRKWHQNYALYWARKLSPFTVRALGPLSLVAGLAILKTIL